MKMLSTDSNKSSNDEKTSTTTTTQLLSNQSVCVLVLGDIGRSPRMQYHSLSLANNGAKVNFIGYSGTNPHESVLSHPNINLISFQPIQINLSSKSTNKYVKFLWFYVRITLLLINRV